MMATSVIDLSVIPSSLLLQAIASVAEVQNVGLYAVGGFVRDFLLGKTNTDLDLVVEGDAIAFVGALVQRYGGRLKEPTRFGTVKWEFEDKTVDFATARTETYDHPGALPTVSPSTLDNDLSRRDFSINAMAIRLAPPPYGTLIDPFDGAGDLNNKIVRVLHDKSFIDDGTRMFRAVRFEQRFNFAIESHTESLIPAALPVLTRISGERLRHEIVLVFAEPHPVKAMRRLDHLGLLRNMSERLVFDEWADETFVRADWQLAQPTWKRNAVDPAAVYWSLLACRLDDTAALAHRLQVTKDEKIQLDQGRLAYRRLPALEAAARSSDIAHSLDGLTEPSLVAAWAMAPTDQIREKIAWYAMALRYIRPITTGDDLLVMGLPPGPRIGKLLNRLRQACLDGEIVGGLAEEQAFIKRWLGGEIPE